jgi:hypothetical protein
MSLPGEVTVEELRPGEEEPRVLTSLFSGAHFGEYSLIRTQPRVASVIARGKGGTTCRFLRKAEFQKLVAEDLNFRTLVEALVRETEATRRKREVILLQQSGGSGGTHQVSFTMSRSNTKVTPLVRRGTNEQKQEFVNNYVFLRTLGLASRNFCIPQRVDGFVGCACITSLLPHVCSSGTYGRVSLCKDARNDRIYAIKVVDKAKLR